MTEIELMRSRRKENTSADAFGFVSAHKNMPMTKQEIRTKSRTLEAEMLYLEGYITPEELYSRIVAIYQERDEGLVCSNCGKMLSYLVWNDFAVYDDMVRYISLPLPVNNVVGNFKRQREEAAKSGEKIYKSYLLKESTGMDRAIELIKMGYEMRGEHLEVGLSCPHCRRMLDYSHMCSHIPRKTMAS